MLSGAVGEAKLFELIHFNKNHPENMNIKPRDLSRDKIGFLKDHDDDKELWGLFGIDELVDNHQERTHGMYKKDIQRRYKDHDRKKIPSDELEALREIATPSSEHKKQTRHGLLEVMKRHKN